MTSPGGHLLRARTSGCGAAFVFYVPALVLGLLLTRLLPEDLPWWGRLAVGVLIVVVFAAALLLAAAQLDGWLRGARTRTPRVDWIVFAAGVGVGLLLATVAGGLLSRLF
ncbi:hypothetical protein R8Z50_07280 [Longispora sp. K20-0274]|uniref:hypothetical protein n=1 Tax=Longispora sp. K20-0274 TaxID=3088255 RepID=UPI00399C3F2D